MPAVAVDTKPLVVFRSPVSPPIERLLVNRLVEEAVVAKKLVEVAPTKSALVKWEVEEAIMPSVKESGVVVELESVL